VLSFLLEAREEQRRWDGQLRGVSSYNGCPSAGIYSRGSLSPLGPSRPVVGGVNCDTFVDGVAASEIDDENVGAEVVDEEGAVNGDVIRQLMRPMMLVGVV
jgi:hypothetical protein